MGSVLQYPVEASRRDLSVFTPRQLQYPLLLPGPAGRDEVNHRERSKIVDA